MDKTKVYFSSGELEKEKKNSRREKETVIDTISKMHCRENGGTSDWIDIFAINNKFQVNFFAKYTYEPIGQIISLNLSD